MEKKDENKVILKQWTQVFIIVIALVLCVFSLWLIVKSFSHEENTGKELYSYNYNDNLDYKVYLKPNNFFTTPYIGMNKQYIASLIDHIDVDMKYNFSSSKDLNYEYSYEIFASLKGLYSESEGAATEIWSKSYPITPIETKSGTGNNFSINKTVTIDYNNFNQIMTDFRNQFGLSVDSRVDINFKINVTGGLSGKEKSLQESNTMVLQIPLLKQTVQLKPDYTNSGKNTIQEKVDNKQGVKLYLLFIGLLLLAVSIYLIKVYVAKLLVTTKKSEYILRLNKILKEYGDVIAESDNLPSLDKYDIVTIKQFNDLIDIEEELHSPILCTEIRRDLETWFIILHVNTAYRYILKYEDFGKIIHKN